MSTVKWSDVRAKHLGRIGPKEVVEGRPRRV